MSRSWPWYVSRLRAMEPAEVALRARRMLSVRVDDAAWRAARPLWRRAWERDDRRLLACRPVLEGPLGIVDDDGVALVRELAPSALGPVVSRAEAALEGRVQLLGYPEVVLEEPVDPSFDPISGRRWPERHGKLLDYRDAAFGDPKWIWELDRCQELPLLTLAWRATGDDRFAETALRRMLSWLDRSPPGRGIAWSNGFEAGLRAISFALCYDGLRGFRGLDANGAAAVLRGLWQHARFTIRDLSPASSANNHVVGELAGLAAVGLLAPELRDASRFARLGLDGLAVEAERQVLPDGTGAEHAFAYHLFVLDLLLLVTALADRREAATPAGLRDALVRAAGALAAQVCDDEPEPAYGDADDGRAFLLDGEPARTVRGVAASLAACLGHGDAKTLAGGLDSAAVLLFGEVGRRRFASAGDAAARGNLLLDASGLVVLRRGGVRALVDTGPLGYLSIAAHGHADALQVTVADGELELVTDPGTGSYFGDSDRRAAFRGTPFHATVTVDGLDQAEQAGPFLWRRHYRTTLHAFDPELGAVVAEHDGYARLPDPVRHRRAVIMLEDGSLLVYDRLDAPARHRFVQSWPLHPSIDASVHDQTLEGRVDGSRRLLLTTAATTPGALYLRRGETSPLAGWHSRRLEEAEPAWIAQHVVEASGGTGIAALLLVGDEQADSPLDLEQSGTLARLTFSFRGRPRTLEIDLDDARRPVRITSRQARVRA